MTATAYRAAQTTFEPGARIERDGVMYEYTSAGWLPLHRCAGAFRRVCFNLTTVIICDACYAVLVDAAPPGLHGYRMVARRPRLTRKAWESLR